jgi:L-serine dehydratase
MVNLFNHSGVKDMAISVFDIFKIGIGPSSTHTTGPMKAARRFVTDLDQQNILQQTSRINVELYGSLAATGKGHRSHIAILLGLEDHQPEEVDPGKVDAYLLNIRQHRQINLLGKHLIPFTERDCLQFCYQTILAFHPNGMRFTAYNSTNDVLSTNTYYSVGGGFIVEEHDTVLQEMANDVPHPFSSAEQLIKLCAEHNFSISRLMMENEKTWRSEQEIRDGLMRIWQVMRDCVSRGCQQTGVLPGGLNIERRAAKLYQQLSNAADTTTDPLTALDWVDVYAMAVNEENAAGGRVVTAPTNGAAGIIPAVLHYYIRFCPQANDEGVIRFLLTAAAIGILYNSSFGVQIQENSSHNLLNKERKRVLRLL